MVAWVYCPVCDSPVDEFEIKCSNCGSFEAVEKIKEGD